MWYDKYHGVPPHGSLLETVFVLVMRQRKEAELLATRALVLGSLAQLTKDAGSARQALEGFQTYCDAMFPHLAKVENLEKQKAIDILNEHVKHPVAINIASVRQEKAQQRHAQALKRYKVRKVAVPGTAGGMGNV